MGSKYKNKIKPYIRSSLYKKKEKNNNIYKKVSKSRINSKRTADNSSTNIMAPNTFRRGANESLLDKTSSNYKYNSELNSFDIEVNKEIEKNSKFNTLRRDNDKKKEKDKEKVYIKNKNRFQSIKVNKNNCLEKGSKNTLNSVNTNGNNNNANNVVNTTTNNNSNNNTVANNNANNNVKKIVKNKARLQSCKFTNEQIYKLEKEIIQENKLLYIMIIFIFIRKIMNYCLH